MSTNSFTEEAPPRKARIEIIPLIDVVFFLLATFVLFTLSLNQTGGVRVNLPAVVTHEERNPANALTISVLEDGRLAWNKEEGINLGEFIERLKAYKLRETSPHILINGDQKAHFTQIRYVLDEIRKQDIYKVTIETRISDAK